MRSLNRGSGVVAERNAQVAQFEKLLGSRVLHGSESLCKLLRYLSNHSQEHPGVSPKEYQIATEVFGRHQDFDPHLDSMVRVQAGRLRAKLAEYYAVEGSEDQLLVEIPKGTYALTFRTRPPSASRAKPAAESRPEPSASSNPLQLPFRWVAALVLFAMILATTFAVAIDRLMPRRIAEAQSSSNAPDAPLALRAFWKRFLAPHAEPWVIFSNAAFVGRPESGMRYYNATRDTQARILDHYTGVGEVLAVHALDNAFRSLHHDLRVKRGSLFSLDDARNDDLILIGSPSENLILLEIPSTRDFVFRTVSRGISKGNVEILNAHPLPNEPQEFLGSPPSEPLTDDYSVIALKNGLDPAHSVLILAGTTTIGTQAAVEYVCQPNSLDELLRRLSVSDSDEVKPFEAVIHVKVARGVPVNSELVAVHTSR